MLQLPIEEIDIAPTARQRERLVPWQRSKHRLEFLANSLSRYCKVGNVGSLKSIYV